MSRWMATEKPCDGSKAVPVVDAVDYDQLKAENERLASAIRYEQHLADRIGTHGPDCWAWGNAHYECLKCKHQQHLGESILERDTLRKQLDEARELLSRLEDYRIKWLKPTKVELEVVAWLEANK